MGTVCDGALEESLSAEVPCAKILARRVSYSISRSSILGRGNSRYDGSKAGMTLEWEENR